MGVFANLEIFDFELVLCQLINHALSMHGFWLNHALPLNGRVKYPIFNWLKDGKIKQRLHLSTS